VPPDEDHQRLVINFSAISDFCDTSPWLENVCMVFVARRCPNIIAWCAFAVKPLSLKWCIILVCLRNLNYEIFVV
jgi:hypothetical protein